MITVHCDICKRCFTGVHDLNKHSKEHKKEFKCSGCCCHEFQAKMAYINMKGATWKRNTSAQSVARGFSLQVD